ncbi:unnamed protein product [Arctogadus glacialis]
MSDVLEHLSVVSQAFQRDDLTVCQALDSQERCFLELVGLKSTMGPEMAKVAQDVERTGTYKGVILHKVGTTTLLVMKKLHNHTPRGEAEGPAGGQCGLPVCGAGSFPLAYIQTGPCGLREGPVQKGGTALQQTPPEGWDQL